jgi:hypothetical protein
MAENASWDLANREKIIKLRNKEKSSKTIDITGAYCTT